MSLIDALAGLHDRRGARAQAPDAVRTQNEIVALLDVPEAAWAALSDRAAEPNAFYHPGWARAVARHAEGKGGARALLVWDGPGRRRLIGLLPVVPAWRALRLPVPVLVAWQAYAPLTTPLLDRERLDEAARGLAMAAAGAGASALLLPALAEDGPVAAALRRAGAELGIAPRLLNRHRRALLDATQEPDAALAPLGAKKLKELRRQRNRLADSGDVAFRVAAAPQEAAAALDSFLALEAAGWKGARGTALARKSGDAAFVREAVSALVAAGHAEMVTLAAGGRTVAAGIVLRHLRRAYFFKIAYDEQSARASPGVQLTVDITRRLCADPAIDSADSIAVAGHPMIDHVWRARLAVCDALLPVRREPLPFAAIAAAVAARHAAREFARHLFHRIRSLKGDHP